MGLDEGGGSRSRRGSRFALEDDEENSTQSKFRRASRVPGSEIVEVTNAYKAKNELSLGRDGRDKKQRRSMRKKKGKKKKNENEDE